MTNICSGNLQVSTPWVGGNVSYINVYIGVNPMTGGGLKPSATKKLKGCYRKTILLNHYSNNL